MATKSKMIELNFQLWTETKKKYSCLMAVLPANITKEIHKWQDSHLCKEDLIQDEADGGIEREIHVTVLYGFHDDKPAKIVEFLQSIKPIKMKFGKVSLFQNEHDVVKISVESEDLNNLNKRLKESFVYTSNHSNYVAHCTLAYVKSGRGNIYLNDSSFAGKTAMADKLIFSSSTKEKTTITLG